MRVINLSTAIPGEFVPIPSLVFFMFLSYIICNEGIASNKCGVGGWLHIRKFRVLI